LRVSLYSSTPETYLKIRGIPAFERVVANVGEMVATRRWLDSSTPRISVWTTALRDNLAELPDIIDLSARLGVDEVYLQRLVFWGEGLATRSQSIFVSSGRARLERIIDEAERRAALHGLSFRGADALSPRASLLERPPASEPWRVESLTDPRALRRDHVAAYALRNKRRHASRVRGERTGARANARTRNPHPDDRGVGGRVFVSCCPATPGGRLACGGPGVYRS